MCRVLLGEASNTPGDLRQVAERGHEVGAKAWGGGPPGLAGAGGGEALQILASLGLHLWFPLGECTLIAGREGLLWLTGKPPQESSHASPTTPFCILLALLEVVRFALLVIFSVIWKRLPWWLSQ